MTSDPYSGQDLLADVFEDTEDAPMPIGMRDRGFGCRWLWPSPDDPRWQVEVRFLPNGDLSWVGGVKPREEAAAHAPGGVEPSTAHSAPAIGNQESA